MSKFVQNQSRTLSDNSQGWTRLTVKDNTIILLTDRQVTSAVLDHYMQGLAGSFLLKMALEEKVPEGHYLIPAEDRHAAEPPWEEGPG